VAIDAEATAVLADPQQPALRALSSRRLARMAARSGVRALWVVNARGERLAGSEGSAEARATSPVLAPERLARELAAGVQGFFATAPDGSSTDYFVVHSIPHDGRTAGFVVARIALAPLEATWIDLGARTQSERVLVVDERQRVLLSSVPDWKLRTLAGSANAVNGGRLESPVRPVEAPGPSSGGGALTLQAWQTLSPGAQIVDAGIAGTPWRCLAQDSPVPGLGVRVLALSDTAETWRRARWSALGGGAAGAFVGLLWIYLRYRQRSLAQMARARDDLRRARDELERQVLERTRQLSEANGEL